MLKQITIYTCDVCKKEIDDSDVLRRELPILYNCSQDDGAPVTPYISFQKLDICRDCLLKATIIKGGFRTIEGLKKD